MDIGKYLNMRKKWSESERQTKQEDGQIILDGGQPHHSYNIHSRYYWKDKEIAEKIFSFIRISPKRTLASPLHRQFAEDGFPGQGGESSPWVRGERRN